MNPSQYEHWRSNTLKSLLAVYSTTESETIMSWFDHIKGSGEYELLGEDRFDSMQKFLNPIREKEFNLYQHLSARVWAYAPIILENENKCK